jgi:hypothetical protein
MTALDVVARWNCDSSGVPLGWAHCENCPGAACVLCHGHGSVHDFVLHAIVGVSGARCEQCHHPRDAGSWEGPSVDAHDLQTLPQSLTECELYERQGLGVFFSVCDDRCDHGGPGRVSQHGLSTMMAPEVVANDVYARNLVRRLTTVPGAQFEASFRQVQVRTANGWPNDLRQANLTVLCLRCWDAKQA